MLQHVLSEQPTKEPLMFYLTSEGLLFRFIIFFISSERGLLTVQHIGLHLTQSLQKAHGVKALVACFLQQLKHLEIRNITYISRKATPFIYM